ncbi:MAG: monovalent cation:proton antiporter-2 (CPA2) family protein [Mariprofundaceae bacterium]|nr:monovalent cation:proton antiporter-2 (CPA2) family protein [Mariprofundaceae bacterium]
MTSPHLIDIVILLASAVVAVPLFKFVKLGAVPGFLVAGVIVGPFGLGLISNLDEIGKLAEIGVVLLLFVIGVELKPSRLWRMRRLVFVLGTLQVLITGLALAAIAYSFFALPMRSAILAGTVLALSSTAFVLQLLAEQRALSSPYGRASFAILLLQDLAVVPLLALVPLLAMPEVNFSLDIIYTLAKSLLVLGLVILLGHYFLRPIFRHIAISDNPEIFTASAVLLVLGTALLTEHLGLSMAMGAFLAGLLISNSPYKHQVMAEISPFRGFFLGLFFMSMGMLLNLNLFLDSPVSSLAVVLLLIFIKAVLLYFLAQLFGFGFKTSLAIALMLAQSGEFALVIFSMAHQTSILSNELFQQLLLIVLLSMLATPALAYFAQLFTKNTTTKKELPSEKALPAPIVIAGFGRVGRRVGEILTMANRPYVALDSDARIVERERENGHPIFYGDACRTKLLEAAGAANAQVIIVTTRGTAITEQIVASLRQAYPNTVIYVRGHSLEQCRELQAIGATGSVSETIEASLELARMTLRNIGIDKKERTAILNDFRRSYHKKINQPESDISCQKDI